jgi:inosine/xanthosine triphosphate pyrophosphatase family protein/dephospho-CoA kinase
MNYTPPSRPTPREMFLVKDRQLQIFFYTSSLPKYLHARTVFERSGLMVHEFKSRREPYSEDYAAGKEKLLERAINEILGSVGTGSLFFVEDTSLRIDALSTQQEDYPGLSVKEWFPSTTFDALDRELRLKGNNRRAVIKSDIALHVPGLTRPVYFHGETAGLVANQEPSFEENPQYPWLTPNTFNGWFIPEGATRPLGQMSLEESWHYDFRTRALEQLLGRLEEYTGILNLVGSYTRRPIEAPVEQLSLLPPLAEPRSLIVVGHTCAGKTTFGEYARTQYHLDFVEASSVLRMIQGVQVDGGADPFMSAKETLEELGPDAVARKILQLYGSRIDKGIVITGFRTIEELEVTKKQIPRAKIVLIEAAERTRFQRHLERRRQTVRSLEQFRELDEQQWSFGLLRVAEDFADVRISNEGTKGEYHRQIDAVLSGAGVDSVPGISINVQPRHKISENQLYRTLQALTAAGRPLSCDEIQELTSKSGNPVRHNNANKVLKRVPELARRLELQGTRVRYAVTSAGRAYVRYMEQRSRRARSARKEK